MKISPKQAKILELTNTDLKLLSVMTEPRTISEIASLSKVPRTSIAYILKKLEKRGLCTHTKKQWITISQSDLASLFKSLYDDSQNRADSHTTNKNIIIHTGVSELVGLYEYMLQLKRHERIFALQPNQSTELVLKKFPAQKLQHINQHLRDMKIIVEGILHESAIKHYIDTLNKQNFAKTKVKQILSDLVDRLADTTYIPDNIFAFNSELFIIRDTALIFNWHDEIGVEITNSDIVNLLKEFFVFVKLHGKKVDQNPRIRAVIQKI